jgi:hypothetical protein
MIRTGLLGTVALLLASSSSFGQFGGVGGMGGQGMAPGTTMQGGRVAGTGAIVVRRPAEVEMEGGQRLSGKLDVRPLAVESDLGRYVVTPYKIKMIRFLKPVDDGKPLTGPEGNNEGPGIAEEVVVARGAPQVRPMALRSSRAGGGGGGFAAEPETRGKVITTTNAEIVGRIYVPAGFTLELEFGSLALALSKLRSITFTDERREDKPARSGATRPGDAKDVVPVVAVEEAPLPRYFRHGNCIIVISPVGDRATLYNVDTQASAPLELSGSKEFPLEINPVFDQNLAALMFGGPKITRLAVADTASGLWHAQELREPVEGRAVPIVSGGIVVYNLGRDVYAYGAESHRWDVAQMPEGIRAAPSVGSGSATIESDGHIFTFSGKTGKWNHVDVRAIMSGAAAEKK